MPLLHSDTPKEQYEALRAGDPDAKISFDGWIMRYDAPHVWDMEGTFKGFVDNMDKDKAFFIDLWPEWKLGGPLYKETKYEYIENRKFFVAFLNEFGGNDYLHGCYDTAISEIKELKTNEKARNCAGIGNATEVMYFNVNYYDLMFRLGWDPVRIKKDEFVDEQVLRRYGPELFEQTHEAYSLFINAVHTGQITAEAYYQRRPLLHSYGYRSMPRSCSRKVIRRLTEYFEKALPVPELGKQNVYLQNDMYDAMRQYITELTNLHFYGI